MAPSIKSTAKQTAELIRVYRGAVAQAAAARDPKLSAEGQAEVRDAAQAKARTEALAAIARNRRDVKWEAERAIAAFEDARPRIKHDAADLIDFQQHWEYQIRPQLDAGTPLKKFLLTATERDTLAAERFGTGYLTTKAATDAHAAALDLDVDQLEAAVIGRLAVVAEPGKADAIENGYRARYAAEKFAEVATLAESEISGENNGFGGDRWGHAASIALRLPDDGADDAA